MLLDSRGKVLLARAQYREKVPEAGRLAVPARMQ